MKNTKLILYILFMFSLFGISAQAGVIMVTDWRSINVDPGSSIFERIQDFNEIFDESVEYSDDLRSGKANQHSYYSENGDLIATGYATAAGWLYSSSNVGYSFEITDSIWVTLIINSLIVGDGGDAYNSVNVQLRNTTANAYIFRVYPFNYENESRFYLEPGLYNLFVKASAGNNWSGSSSFDMELYFDDPQSVPEPGSTLLLLAIGLFPIAGVHRLYRK